MASQPSKAVRELEADCPSALEKKQFLPRQGSSQPSPPTCTIPPHNGRDDPARRNMPSSLRKTILALLVGVILLFSLVTAVRPHPCPFDHTCRRGEAADAAAVAAAHHHGPSGSSGDETAFSCLLNAVSPEALHEVLLRYFPGRFKQGVWPSDQSAMEAVHRDDPPLATSLVQIAKRQAGSNTTITTTTVSTTTPTTTLPTTTVDTTTIKTPSTTTTFSTTTSTDTNRPVSSTTPTTPPANAQTMRTGPSTTTTPELSRTTTRSSRPVTSMFTSTGPNGEVNIVTLTTYVGAESSGTSKTEAEGSLQTNAAVATSRHVAAEALAGVVLGGLMLV